MTDGRPVEDLPPFNPLRMVTDAQREAIDTASRVVGRFLETIGRPADDGFPPLSDDDADRGFEQVRASVMRTVDLYLDLLQRATASSTDLAQTVWRQRGVVVGGEDPSMTRPLTMEADAGGVAEGAVWLHNLTDAPLGPRPLLVTPLSSYEGDVIPAASTTVEPGTMPSVPPGASAKAVVRVDAGRAAPGCYFGHLLTAQAALAVHLAVPG